MSKFRKNTSKELPAISTASLPDIVFMLLFFFMVVTVLRDDNLLVQNTLPKADQVEKLKKDRSVFIYAGSPSSNYQDKYGKEAKIQIGDKYADVADLKFALTESRQSLRPELQDKVMVALKIEQNTKSGFGKEIKKRFRKLKNFKNF